MVPAGRSGEFRPGEMEPAGGLVHRGGAGRFRARAAADSLQAQQLHILCATAEHLRA